MSKSFFDSTTIRAGLDVQKNSSTPSTIGVVAGTLAPILLSELGLGDHLNSVLSEAVHGAISGQSIEAIAVGAGLTTIAHWINKKKNKKLTKRIVKGRIQAMTTIKSDTIPVEYSWQNLSENHPGEL